MTWPRYGSALSSTGALTDQGLRECCSITSASSWRLSCPAAASRASIACHLRFTRRRPAYNSASKDARIQRTSARHSWVTLRCQWSTAPVPHHSRSFAASTIRSRLVAIRPWFTGPHHDASSRPWCAPLLRPRSLSLALRFLVPSCPALVPQMALGNGGKAISSSKASRSRYI